MKYYIKDNYYYELGVNNIPVWRGNKESNATKTEEIEVYLVEHPEALIPEPQPHKPTEAELAERARQETLAWLAELDRLVPRALEDVIKALGIKPHEKTQAVIDEKTELRAKL